MTPAEKLIPSASILKSFRRITKVRAAPIAVEAPAIRVRRNAVSAEFSIVFFVEKA